MKGGGAHCRSFRGRQRKTSCWYAWGAVLARCGRGRERKGVEEERRGGEEEREEGKGGRYKRGKGKGKVKGNEEGKPGEEE